MKTRATILALTLAGSVAGSATAQVPTLQVFSDSSLKEPFIRCGTPDTVAELFVVMRNVFFPVSAVDFEIEYSSTMSWLGPFLNLLRDSQNQKRAPIAPSRSKSDSGITSRIGTISMKISNG